MGIILNAFTYLDIFFLSNRESCTMLVGFITGIFVQKCSAGDSSTQLNTTSL